MIRPIAALTLLVFTTSEARAECSDAEKRQLEALDRAWGDATNSGNRSYLENLYAADFAGLAGPVINTKGAAIDSAMAQSARARANPGGAPRNTYDNYVIACTPNTATITHRSVSTETFEGKEETFYSRAIHVLEKRGGRWQVVSTTGHALPDGAVLLSMENAWNEAYKKRDVAWFERNLSPNATEIDATATFRNRSQVLEHVRTDTNKWEQLDLSDMNVRVEGNTGVVTGVNRVRGRNAQGAAVDQRYRFTDVFVKQDGQWKILTSHSTRIP